MNRMKALGLFLIFPFLSTTLAPAVGWAAAPAPVADSGRVLDDDETPPPALPDTDKLVSMNFDGALLKDVLRILSQQSGLNFAASEEVETKKVTVYLENVPVKDALESILNANSLRYEQRPGSSVFTVYPVESTEGGMQTKIYTLKYKRVSISPSEVGSQSVVTDLLKPEEVTALTSGGGNNAAAAQTGAAAGAPAGGETASATTSALTAERGIDKIVASLLSEGGKISVDLWTNSLIVTDTPATLAKIDRVLKRIDVPTQQVMIEVHFIEVKKTLVEDLGVDWGGTHGALMSYAGPSRTTGFPFTEKVFNINKGLAATTEGSSTLTLGTLSATNLAATLRFIQSTGDAKILARPRVLTFNNEAANIKLVTRAAIAKTSTLTASEGVTTVTNGQAERTDVGISLKMTPQVNDGRYVSLFVEPSVTTVTASSFFPTDFLDPTTRSVRTTARVRDGETLVLGGLIDRDDETSIKEVPVLSAVPLLGNAFRYKSRTDTDRELIIFITPRIVDQPDITADAEQGVAVKRMLDHFRDDEIQRTVEPISDQMRASAPVYREERALVGQTAKRGSDPALDREMSRALDTLNPKNGNPK